MEKATAQEEFWRGNFGDEYSQRVNSDNLIKKNEYLFSRIFNSSNLKINSILEFGANIGLNIKALQNINDKFELSAIEINSYAASMLKLLNIKAVFEESILNFKIDYKRDLVFTKTVLIHINPQELQKVYQALYESSRKYILIIEYYNPTPVEVEYRGYDEKLFKRDFAGDLLDKFKDLELVNYGFMYKRDLENPMDDLNWFLLEKRDSSKIDEYKTYRQKWKLATSMETLTEAPLHLDIELTNKCNLDCNMCWQNEHMTYPKGNMNISLFKKIIDEAVLSGVKAIKLQSRGESTLHPSIIECINYAKNKGIIDIQLTTNATLFSNEVNENLLTSGLDLLIISIDSDHIESYNRIYKNKNYEIVVANILDILKMRKNKELKYPKIRIQIASGTNKLDPLVEKYIDDFKRYADIFNISPYFLLQDNNPEIKNYKTTPCPYPWQRMVINYDGKVTVCCRDYNCTQIMGDVTQESIKDIWNSDKYNNFRKIHKEGKRNMINFCRVCNE